MRRWGFASLILVTRTGRCPLDSRGFEGHPWPTKGWPTNPLIEFVCFNSSNQFALGQTRTDTPEALDPKSSASTNSATRACKLFVFLTKTIDLQLYLPQPLSVKPGLGVVSATILGRDEAGRQRIFNAGTHFSISHDNSSP